MDTNISGRMAQVNFFYSLTSTFICGRMAQVNFFYSLTSTFISGRMAQVNFFYSLTSTFISGRMAQVNFFYSLTSNFISGRTAQVNFFYSLTSTFIFKLKVLAFIVILQTSFKRWEIEQKLPLPSDRKSSICHRMALLRMFILYDLDLYFQGHEFWNVSI